MYATTTPQGMRPDECKAAYCDYLKDADRFDSDMRQIGARWPVSCLQFLTNTDINRIAWLGQAAMCFATGVPRRFRGGFNMLSAEKRNAANACAEAFLVDWINENNKKENRAVPRGMAKQGVFGWYS